MKRETMSTTPTSSLINQQHTCMPHCMSPLPVYACVFTVHLSHMSCSLILWKFKTTLKLYCVIFSKKKRLYVVYYWILMTSAHMNTNSAACSGFCECVQWLYNFLNFFKWRKVWSNILILENIDFDDWLFELSIIKGE